MLRPSPHLSHSLRCRSEFEGLLEKAPSEANSFLADPEKYIAGIRANPDAAAREQMEKVVGLLVDDRYVDGRVWGGGGYVGRC